MGHLLGSRESHRLAADRVVLAEGVPLPVVVHEDPLQVRMALELDPHEVVRLALVPVGGRPDGDYARNRLSFLAPDLEPDAWCPAGAGDDCDEVIRDREALRFRLGLLREAPGAGPVDVAPAAMSPVAGHGAVVPAEVVGSSDVGEEVEAALVAQVLRCLAKLRRLDDHGRFAAFLGHRCEPGDVGEVHDATPRISYAGGTPARIFSCSRTMPSRSASGRGGQPGTCTSTGTTLSTPWRTA